MGGCNCHCCQECCLCECNCKSCKDIFLLIGHLVSACLSIAIIFVIQNITFDSEISMSIAEEITYDLNRQLYMDFKDCSRINDNPLAFDKWRGTVPGCGIVKKKEARILEKGKKCEEDEDFLDEIPSQDFLSYKGVKVCPSTKGKSYYDLLFDGSIINKNKTCPENKKNCGIIDTLDNILCYDKNSDCPINYVSFSKEKPKNINHLQQINGTEINFYFSNNPYENKSEDTYIAGSFRIADSKMCTIPYLYYSDKRDLYVLDPLNREEKDQCVLIGYDDVQKYSIDLSKRYHQLDRINHYNLYNENNIIEKIVRHNLTYYGYNIDSLKDHDLFLYIRTFFGYNRTCLEEREERFTVERLNSIHGKADKQKTWSNWMYSSLVNIVPSILDFWTLTKNKKYDLIKFFPWILSSVGLFIYTCVAMGFDDYYEEEMGCADYIINNNYNIMTRKVIINGDKIFITFILQIIMIIFECLIFIYRAFEKCKDPITNRVVENNENSHQPQTTSSQEHQVQGTTQPPTVTSQEQQDHAEFSNPPENSNDLRERLNHQ